MMFDKVIAAVDKKLERFDPIWQAENGVGGQRDRYYDKTGVAKWREWRGVKDTMVDYGAWLKNLASMAMMVASAPIPCLKGFWEYRWMGSYLGTFMFIDRLFEGFRGYELVTAHKCMHAIVRSLTKKIAFVLSNDRRLGGGKDTDRIVPMDEVLPPLFMMGFKELIPFPLQTLPEFIICDVDQHIEPYYIDVAESFGLPADVCSRCAAETGVALDDAFPLIGKAMISTNMPCNASEATSMFQRRRIGLPDFQHPLTHIAAAEDRALLRQGVQRQLVQGETFFPLIAAALHHVRMDRAHLFAPVLMDRIFARHQSNDIADAVVLQMKNLIFRRIQNRHSCPSIHGIFSLSHQSISPRPFPCQETTPPSDAPFLTNGIRCIRL